ncbi:cytochrome c biogenesis protein [Sediminihabitans luteus]|uniref:Cytochrome c biogenesis protein n=1 Tax=Sediminihabitans luteus TaxID=1138585 RepID=A0A2M9D038_9CELL|nr:cytochrome c biogenesis protein ResB [Sediminihabitans luteus]PJJ77368.1 cytochrome c biogenesis protein [Sediminihabitans luteus]GII98261.1 cytochrome c biogenesis protein ResB [Sediminihabitans luteus]
MGDKTTSTGGYRPEGIDDAFSDGTSIPEPGTPEPGTPQPGTPQPGGSGAPGSGSTTAPVLPALGWRGTLRWTWRQLTSMRVALMLLMLLAVAAVPGSVLPQNAQDPAAVVQYVADHPTTGPWLDRLGFFSVYSSVWFSAIYILLFVSLVGCILPRALAHGRALRSTPPRTPRTFGRFPAQAAATTTATPDAVVEGAVRHLRSRFLGLPRFRVVEDTTDAARERGERTVTAERGYLRETGNLVFHLALLGLLVSVATGQLLHFRAQAIVIEGRGFANSVVDYDTFENGALFDPSSLEPFTMTLDSFESEFTETGEARDFTAHVGVTDPDGTQHEESIKVNHPLDVGGAKIYLQGNGFAPSVTVTDGAGEVAFEGAVPFIPEDQVYTSRGVVKVPDVSPGQEQLGFVGYFLPTAQVSDDGAVSLFPQPYNPMLVLDVYEGDLGLDDGLPQNVYRLDTSEMTPVLDDDGERLTVELAPGDTVTLPDGLGTISFDALPRYVALDLRHDPALTWILVFALSALGGLALSLFTPRRRVWVRVAAGTGDATGRTVITAAGLARHDDAGLQAEVDALVAALPGAGTDEQQGPAVGPAQDKPAADAASDRTKEG